MVLTMEWGRKERGTLRIGSYVLTEGVPGHVLLGLSLEGARQK